MTQARPNTKQLSSLQQSLLVIQKLKSKLNAMEREKTGPVAIVGMGCRFPGANNPEEFWHLLRNGIDTVTEIPPDRWDIDKYYDPDPDVPGKMSTRKGAFLKQVDHFDPLFFGISPREAISMDPQQRLLLEVSWEALEHAGQNPHALGSSRTGVFAGIGQHDYAQLRFLSGNSSQINAYDGTGNGLCYASGRLSFILGLQGPNLALDTACSSSLVAVHLACQSLQQSTMTVIAAVLPFPMDWHRRRSCFRRSRMPMQNRIG
jgi:acyl transferase domain-containing protein